MPKATLSFTLPEENDEFEMATKASSYLYALDELDNYLRGKIKYGELPEHDEAIYQEIRDKLHEFKS